MYNIAFSKQASKTLLKMPRNVAVLIREKLEHIAEDPYAPQANVTRLQNRPGFRLRVGDWRVIYDLRTDQLMILVLKIAPRGEVYR